MQAGWWLLLAVAAIVAIVAAVSVRRRAASASASVLLGRVRRGMQTDGGWSNVGRSGGPDNAVAHCFANMIAVRGRFFASPERALWAFQLRETDDDVRADMDRANNIEGNSLGQEEGDIIVLLQGANLTWVGDGGELTEGTYPGPNNLENLRSVAETMIRTPIE